MKKLKDFREMAREVLENPKYIARGEYSQRFEDEEERLNAKIREMQRKDPDTDYTELFETERAELARKAMHKKTLASYKAFEFLKHGVELRKQRLKTKE